MAAPPPINSGDTAWVLMSTGLVMLMIPGLGYFYSGLARHKNALSLIFLSMLSLAVVSFQWFIWGFSLAFSPHGNPFIGNLDNAFLMGVFDNDQYRYDTTTNIPGSVFMLFQGMFAAITPALAFGGAAERTRFVPCIVFLFIWSTLVYDIIAYWTWAPGGFLRTLGSLDYAGGTPVHIASGAAGLAYAIVAGRRHGWGNEPFKPHNLSSVFLGTALLWFGWFGFNAGSGLGANARAALALANTNLSASVGGMTWVILDYIHSHKFSAFAFCSGAVAGLVSITPAAGFVPVWAAPIFGFVAALVCAGFISIKHRFKFDDALDSFGVHGVGGLVGNLLTGIFATSAVTQLDGSAAIPGGWISGNFMQILIQLAASVAGFAWSFLVTLIILLIMNRIPYLNLRLTHEKEMLGVDKAQMGEVAYDYIEAAVTMPLSQRADSLTEINIQPSVLEKPITAESTDKLN